MKTLTPEQMEDATINDAINTAVGLHLRKHRREMLNVLRDMLTPEILSARLNGREIDVDKLMARALNLANVWTSRE